MNARLRPGVSSFLSLDFRSTTQSVFLGTEHSPVKSCLEQNSARKAEEENGK